MPDKLIGLVGVGLLGSALAERILSANMKVLGFDIDASRLTYLQELGGTSAESIQQIAMSCQRILLSLPTSDVVNSVLCEIETHLRDNTIVIDTTTGDPQMITGFGPRLKKVHVNYLDATVAGSSKQARAGEVIVIVGGDQVVFERCQDVFDCFARESYYVGEHGNGARMKLVVNLVLGLNRAVLAEGLAFARSYGVDPHAALEILKVSPAYSRAMDTKGQKMLAEEFSTEARLSQHLKDVRLILDAASQCGAHLPFSSLHGKLLEQLANDGFADADNSAIIKAFE